MATVGKRKPTPKKTKAAPRAAAMRRVSPLKPGMRNARNWATAQMRAASYSRAGAVRMTTAVTGVILAVIISGLWLGGFMPNVREAGSDFTKSRLIAMGFTVDNIDVIGEGRIREDEVHAALGIRSGDYLFDIDVRTAQQRVQSLSWIDDAVVRRLWPDRIVVHIIERQPVALWQHEGQVSVIDSKSRVIEAAIAEDFSGLPMIVGKDAAAKSQGIYDVLRETPAISQHVQAIIHVGERRWDISLTGGRPRLMLPEQNPAGALRKIEALQASHGILDLELETIDMRVDGRLVVRPSGKRGAA